MMKISFRNNILFLVFQALYAFLFFFFLKNVDSVASSEYKVSFKGNENRGSYGQIGYRQHQYYQKTNYTLLLK